MIILGESRTIRATGIASHFGSISDRPDEGVMAVNIFD